MSKFKVGDWVIHKPEYPSCSQGPKQIINISISEYDKNELLYEYIYKNDGSWNQDYEERLELHPISLNKNKIRDFLNE